MRHPLALLALLVWAGSAPGDPLADSPTLTGYGLQALDVPELSASDPLARSAMEQARQAVNEQLQAGASANRLVEPLGQLCMLYQAHKADSLARACYDNLRVLDPDSWRWHYYSAYLSQKAGYPELALQTYAAGEHAAPPGDPYLSLRRGQAWLDLNQLDKAEQAFATILERPELEASAAYGLGQVALLRRQYDRAIAYFERALQRQPQATRVHFPLAQALRASGRADEARAQLALQGKGTPQAEDPLIRAVHRVATGARPLFMAAMDAIKQKDLATAIDRFRQGLAIEPGNGYARTSLARALYLDGQATQAREEFERAAQGADGLQGRFLLAVLQQAGGETEAAQRSYAEVLQSQPTHGGAHFYLGRLALQRNDNAGARQHAEAAVRFDASNSPAHLLLAEALARLGDEAAMRAALDQARQRFEKQPIFDYALVRLLSLATDPAVKDPAQGLHLAEALAERYPLPPNQALLALATAATGDFDKAAALQSEVVKQLAWTPQADSASDALTAYRERRMPALALWPADDPMLDLGPVNVLATIASYPVARPF